MKYAILLLVALSCVGCGHAKPLYGTVVRKMYHPAWTEIRMETDGKGHVSTSTVKHPPRWEFVIQKEDTSSDEGQQLIRTTENEYNRLDVGRIWYRKDTVIEK